MKRVQSKGEVTANAAQLLNSKMTVFISHNPAATAQTKPHSCREPLSTTTPWEMNRIQESGCVWGEIQDRRMESQYSTARGHFELVLSNPWQWRMDTHTHIHWTVWSQPILLSQITPFLHTAGKTNNRARDYGANRWVHWRHSRAPNTHTHRGKEISCFY